jgi:hypothetical protein
MSSGDVLAQKVFAKAQPKMRGGPASRGVASRDHIQNLAGRGHLVRLSEKGKRLRRRKRQAEVILCFDPSLQVDT